MVRKIQSQGHCSFTTVVNAKVVDQRKNDRKNLSTFDSDCMKKASESDREIACVNCSESLDFDVQINNLS